MSYLRNGLLRASKNNPIVQSKRGKFEMRNLPVVGQFFDKRPVGLPDSVDRSIGMFKMELMLKEMGVTDPYLENATYLNGGTKEDPMQVLMLVKSRLVGCQCEPDQTYFNFMWIHDGETKRCECGYWFKGVLIPNPQLYVLDKAFS